MPMHPVTLRRWEIVTAFAVLTLVFSLVVMSESRIADRAHDLSIENAKRITEIATLRTQHTVADRKVALALCRQNNEMDTRIIAWIVATAQPRTPEHLLLVRFHAEALFKTERCP